MLLSLLRVRQTPYDVRTSLEESPGTSVGRSALAWVGGSTSRQSGLSTNLVFPKAICNKHLENKNRTFKGRKTRSAILLVKFMPGCRMDGRERERGELNGPATGK